MTKLPRNEILLGDATERLKDLPSGSIDCVITSPPYYRLRDYGVNGQIGAEPGVEGWVSSLRSVFRELSRVLKPTGSVWLNLGDTYSRKLQEGAVAHSLLLAPERLLFALAQDGWIVRNKVIWDKTRTTPHPTRDRLTAAYEVIYYLVRSKPYYFDLDAIRDPHMARTLIRAFEAFPDLQKLPDSKLLGRNPGDVWHFAPSIYAGAHFATFPTELVRRPLLASCPEKICTKCSRPWRREVKPIYVPSRRSAGAQRRAQMNYPTQDVIYIPGALLPDCLCNAPTIPGVVLDPFFGSGTVGEVAQKLGRDFIGIELSSEYIKLAKDRIAKPSDRANA